ncbi:MAG: DEAD/DEAH box helicase [Myxococcota bacterium]
MTDITENTPDAPSFSSMGISSGLMQAIEDIGWETPTPVQFECYPRAIEGRDLIVQSRTGTGKTAAFGMPIVDKLVEPTPGVQALILAPTRELALQSAREIGRLAAHKEVRTTAVYGGAPMEKQVRELAQGAQIVSGTPGRVLDHLRRGTLDSSGLRVLVLDEADEMLSMGFAKELNAILELLPQQRQTLLFSATVDGPIQRVGERHMSDPELLELSGDAVGALTISHFVYMVSGKARERDLIRILEIEDPESAIIFCNTKVETERVAGQLQQAGFQADWLNGDLAQREREKIMARTRAGELRYLVATDVAARGIDVSHLTHVINFGLPDHIEQYIHRTGRTGRAGRTGTALSLVAPTELGTLYYLRLQYKIFPVERSLPSAREESTRVEMDRVELLERAAKNISDLDRSVARRILTHADAEGLLAGLLGLFFGAQGEGVDEQAAAARRERSAVAPPIEPASSNTPTDPPPPVESAAPAKSAPEATEESKPERRPERRSEPRDEASSDEVKLYVSIGKKDGVRVGELNRFFQEEGGLERDEVGRIRIRDKHSFVFVPAGKSDDVIAATSGKVLGERELKVERAKSS